MTNKITILGATGDLGREVLLQCLELECSEVTVLARTPSKLAARIAENEKVTVVQGDALIKADLKKALPAGTQAILFCIGVDGDSPQDLCTNITKHIVDIMKERSVDRLIWCGGGSSLLEQDQITFGAQFVQWFAATFLSKRHYDKVHQLEYLQQNEVKEGIKWFGVRPLQMNKGALTKKYRVGYDVFSGTSKISFNDCAHAMVAMVDHDEWIHEAPIIQY